jgi:hypothetical protein
LELAAVAHVEQANFLDPVFQHNFAIAHTARIINTLSPEWLQEYQQLIGDEALYSLIQDQHPHVLEVFEGKFEIVRRAQRLAVEPTPELPTSEPQKKPKLTREEWEARIERYRQRQLDRMRVSADDRIAKMLEKVESARRLRERAEELGLDEDQIERLEQELVSDLHDDEDEQTTGYKQL